MGCASQEISGKGKCPSLGTKREENSVSLCGRQQTGKVWCVGSCFHAQRDAELWTVSRRGPRAPRGSLSWWALAPAESTGEAGRPCSSCWKKEVPGASGSHLPDLCSHGHRLQEAKCALYKATPNFSLAYFSLNKKTNQEKPQEIPQAGFELPPMWPNMAEPGPNRDVYWQPNKQMDPFGCNLDEWSIQVFSIMAISTTTQSISDSSLMHY